MNIVLKKCSLEDQASLQKLCNEVERTYISNCLPLPYTKGDAAWWINMAQEHDGKDGIFRLITVDDKVIGNISVEQKSDIFEKDAEIGYLILPESGSKGIATEAVRQICKIAFSALNIIRITGLVYEPNIASRRALEKNNFILEGIMKNAVVKNNEIYNLCVYGILKQSNIRRKGARSKKEIPADVLKRLNCGEIESANLVEWLAIDRRKLLENVLVQHDRKKYLKPILEQIDNLKKQTVNTINEAIGTELLNQTSICEDSNFLMIISAHQSDLVRSWATFTVGKDTTLSISQMLQKIRPFAVDKHFNVREEAWVAVRPRIVQKLDEGIELLSAWVLDEDENLRRFASEVMRPRGVWCTHIEALKQNPELALPIIEPLKSDKAKYVRDSVGNWLNDASKSQPEFVEKLCKRWEKESVTNETKYIIKKALRTINKSL